MDDSTECHLYSFNTFHTTTLTQAIIANGNFNRTVREACIILLFAVSLLVLFMRGTYRNPIRNLQQYFLLRLVPE